MKNLFYILLSIVIVFVSCKEESKDYVTLSGVITSPNSDSLIVAHKGIIKTIKVNADGSFLDTLQVEAGEYILFDGVEQANVYLKNGYDLKLSLDTKQFDETITYEGVGAEANNYLAQKAILDEKTDYEALLNMDKSAFNEGVKKHSDAIKSLLESTINLDNAFIVTQEEQLELMTKQLNTMFDDKQALVTLRGIQSPKFVGYENYAGGETSLDDLKGKFVYIDLWATWCGPCKAEIPFLKKVEKAYHGKNIEFVSVSVDRQNDYETWRTMVKEKELTGIQLYAKQDRSFVDAYKVLTIPRFILIDPQGKIVNANAPRPSNNKLIKLFEELNI